MTLAARPRSRRRLLGALLAGSIGGLLGHDDVAAACRPPCRRPKRCCGRQCVNTATDPNNCGRCGKRCRPEETCQQGRCKHHCEDGTKNFGESDVDCGRVCDGVLGTSPFGRCRLRKRCEVDRDCRSGVCDEARPGAAKTCVECRIDRHCDIFAEGRPRCIGHFCHECAADFDCPAAGDPPERRFCVADPVCPNNEPCLCGECRQDGDCPEGHLCEDGSCIDCIGGQGAGRAGAAGEGGCPDRCFNGVQDGDESDVDCGGSCDRKCFLGSRCRVDADCADGHCARLTFGEPRARNVCVKCEADDDCPEGESCVGTTCRPVRGTCDSGSDVCDGESGRFVACGGVQNELCWTTTEGDHVCARFANNADPCSDACTDSEECAGRWGHGSVCLVFAPCDCAAAVCGLPV